MVDRITDPSERRAALKILKALNAGPYDADVHFQRHQLRKRLKPFTEAEQAFLKATDRWPQAGGSSPQDASRG